jgi:chromosome segregation ATPase
MADTPQPSADAVAVFGLLSIIADPAAAKSRMDALEQIRASAAAAQEKHRQTLLELRQTTEANTKALAAGDKALAERKAEITNQQSALNAARAQLADKERDLAERRGAFNAAVEKASAEHAQLSAALADRENKLNSREGDLKAREDNVRAEAARLSAARAEADQVKSEYDRKTAALQKALK